MGKSIREERLEELSGLFRLNCYKATFNENAYFVIEADSGSVYKRGSVEISLEGIRLVFVRNKIEIVDGEETSTPISVVEFSNLKREHYLEKYDEKKIYSPEVTWAYEEVRDYSFGKERDEIIQLIHLVMEYFMRDMERTLEEEEIEEKMKLFCEYDMKKEFHAFLYEIANCYNAFINEKNAEMDRDDRAEEIRLNKEFQKQIEWICAKFWIGLDFKIIDSKNVGLGGLSEKIKKYKEVMADIDKYIKMREYYGELSLERGKKKNYKENAQELKIIIDEFENITKKYSKIKQYEEKILKGTANKKDLNPLLEDFEKDIKNCLISLHSLSTFNSFEEYTNQMRLDMGDAGREEIRSLQDYQEMDYSINHTLKEFIKFTKNYNGIDSQLSKVEMGRREEVLAPYIEKLKGRREIYKEKLGLKLRSDIRNLGEKKNMRPSNFIALNQFLEDEIQTLELYQRIDWTIYSKNGQLVWCPDEVKKCQEELSICMQTLNTYKSEIKDMLDKSLGKQIQELLGCSNQGIKASLYDKFMAEKYKEKIRKTATDADKSNIFDKALQKKVSGGGLLNDLLNPISAFDDIESLYLEYLTITMLDETLEKMIAVLENASEFIKVEPTVAENKNIKVSVKSVSLSEADKPTDFATVLEKEGLTEEQISLVLDITSKQGEIANEYYKKDMIQELQRKGFEKEEATYLIGKFFKMQRKVEPEKEAGYYSNNNTEDTENSRFNAMNRR